MLAEIKYCHTVRCALFMDMKPYTTNCVYRMLLPDLDNGY